MGMLGDRYNTWNQAWDEAWVHQNVVGLGVMLGEIPGAPQKTPPSQSMALSSKES